MASRSQVDLSTVDTEPLRREGLTEIHTGERFVGFLDDLRIYNKPLTDAEIRQIYNETKAIYAGRRDTNPAERRQNTYKYQEIDRTLYKAWLQFNPFDTEQRSQDLFRTIVAEGTNSTVQTAASELAQAAESMFNFKPSVSETATVAGPKVILGTVETSDWIRDRAEDLQLDRIEGDGFVIKAMEGTVVVAGRIPAGVIFGTFDLMRRVQIGQDPLALDVLENPQVPIRMVAHWSYFRGLFGDRWRGGGRDDSIFSWEELRTGDTKRIRDWVRMLASCGWNALCPSEINWHYRNNFLEHLDEVEKLADICRDYGIKLYWSPSYLLALDPQTADTLYARVPDFGGYMMKLGSEKQNGDPRPQMTNRIADTLKPYGGKVLVRAFVYGNLAIHTRTLPKLDPLRSVRSTRTAISGITSLSSRKAALWIGICGHRFPHSMARCRKISMEVNSSLTRVGPSPGSRSGSGGLNRIRIATDRGA